MQIIEIAQLADLTDESSMADVVEMIAQRELTSDQALYLSCVDRDDPSQLYDALVHFGATPLEWAE
jgi:hypothetical protein